MSNQISELFVALSDEQVELIAGGIGGISGGSEPRRSSGTDYFGSNNAVQGSNQSGPGGSGSTSAAVSNKVQTGSYDDVGGSGFGGLGRGGRGGRGGFGGGGFF